MQSNISDKKGNVEVEAEIVLSAVGVETNISGMGLEEVGIVTEKGKIVVDDYYQTNIKGIYAIGDIVHGPALAHVASAEGIICVEKISGMDVEPLDYGNIPACTYTSPEVASCGYDRRSRKEKQAMSLKWVNSHLLPAEKLRLRDRSDGFVKLVFDAKYGELLGAHMIGAGVTE